MQGIPHLRYNVQLRPCYMSYMWFSVHNDEARKENVGSKGLESGKPRRHIGPLKDLGYSKCSGKIMTVSRTLQMKRRNLAMFNS